MKKLVLPIVAATALVRAQTPAPSGGFMLDRVLDYPFPDNRVISPKSEFFERQLMRRAGTSQP